MKNFLIKYEKNRIDFEEFLRSFPKDKLYHSTSLPVIFGYYKLLSSPVKFLEGIVIFFDKRRKRYKIIYYDPSYNYDFSIIKQDLYIVSDSVIQLPFKRVKQREILYKLDDIFDLSKYSNAKSRARSFSNPIHRIEKVDFRLEKITKENMQIVYKTYRKWCDFKLADKNTFRMTFSSKNYWMVIENYLNKYYKYFDGFLRLIFIEDKPFGVECSYRIDDICYAMSSFCLFFEFPSNYSEGIKLMIFKEMRENGVRYYNYGLAFNKNLKLYKSHFPNKTCDIFIYKNKL